MRKETSSPNFVDIEHDLLKQWEQKDLFKKIVAKNQNGPRFRFLDGPVTANNRLGIHHIWGRTLKDITIKYNAMQGKSCQYQNGFDAQGMWVEVNVEKELGLNGKPEILKYGMDKFTRKCMERVDFFAGEITEQSKRIGQFMDWDHSYFTNTDKNITSIWAFLKVCDQKGYIVRKKRPMVWCPRCGTSISEHEMSGSYKDVIHNALFIKLPVSGQDFKMVAWTTTPWTLTANVALAVNPELVYVKVNNNGETLVLGKDSLKVLKGEVEILDEFKGDKLVGLEYETCFPELPEQQFVHKIYPWEAVEAGEGSCVVHIAPGCGAEDFDLGLRHNLPQICPINDAGNILDNFGEFSGYASTEYGEKQGERRPPLVDKIIDRLSRDGKLLYSHKYKHSYPYCWRCKTDLVYKLIDTWYIDMQALRPQLTKAIDEVEFKPEFAKKRMLDWLNNMGDWNISRSRFYGLPIPFYICPKCGKRHVIGSLDELREKAVDPSLIDKLPNIHRPWIDDITIRCDCGAEVKRIPEVGDCWLDAGITPFSTKGYFDDPEYFKNNFPSDYVCEMIEQIKLWFYSMLVMSVTLTGKAPYKKIVTYQYVLDENGGEFHKSGGNNLDCTAVCDRFGADPVRYLYAAANPTSDMRFGDGLITEAKRKMIAFWNVYGFFNTYAVLDKPELDGYKPAEASLNVIDRWLLNRVRKFVDVSTKAYEANEYYKVVSEFETLTDDISNFYIRTNRSRFWKSTGDDTLNAYYCLYTAIKTMLEVMAPIIPFTTEYIWQNTVVELEKNAPESVHLAVFPKVEEYDNDLLTAIENARQIIYLGLKIRNENKIKIKQPLKKLFVKGSPEFVASSDLMADQIKSELNVKEIEKVDRDDKFNVSSLVVNFRKAGAVLKARVNELKNTLLNATPEETARYVSEFKQGEKVNIQGFGDLPVDILELKLSPRPEYAVVVEGNNTVVLDVEIDESLAIEGAYRELVRAIQVARKEFDFNISDRIRLRITGDGVDEVLDAFKDNIMSETLAVSIGADGDYPFVKDVDLSGSQVKIEIAINK